MVFTPVLLSGCVITESFPAQVDDQYNKVGCSLAVELMGWKQGWKWHFCISSSITSPCTALALCKDPHDFAPLKSICMALLVLAVFTIPFYFNGIFISSS